MHVRDEATYRQLSILFCEGFQGCSVFPESTVVWLMSLNVRIVENGFDIVGSFLLLEASEGTEYHSFLNKVHLTMALPHRLNHCLKFVLLSSFCCECQARLESRKVTVVSSSPLSNSLNENDCIGEMVRSILTDEGIFSLVCFIKVELITVSL